MCKVHVCKKKKERQKTKDEVQSPCFSLHKPKRVVGKAATAVNEQLAHT
jgi:hypothetical protein